MRRQDYFYGPSTKPQSGSGGDGQRPDNLIQLSVRYDPLISEETKESTGFYEKTKSWTVERKRNFIKHFVGPIIFLAGVALIGEHLINNNPQEGRPSILQNWINHTDYALTGAEFSAEMTEYTVQEGDTLWTIADHVNGVEEVSRDDVANYIKDVLNKGKNLDNLQPGDTILIPVETGKNLDFSSHKTD